jgi:DNA modification methylase
MLRNEIIQGDCLDLIEEQPADSVDLIICDGPYGVTDHDWDRVGSIQEYNLMLIQKFSRVLRQGGTLYLFGKPECVDFIDYRPYLQLNRKIVWYQPSRLAQGKASYTNNYDIICYFSKGKAKTFNLEDIRVPQLVELQHRLRCERVPSVVAGPYSKTKFNEDGKNPGDVWGDIKQLTYKSKELLSREVLNTIQKPKKLIERLVKASSNKGDMVLDPFSGVGTVPTVCQEYGRDFLAFEINPEYIQIARERVQRDFYATEPALFEYEESN